MIKNSERLGLSNMNSCLLEICCNNGAFYDNEMTQAAIAILGGYGIDWIACEGIHDIPYITLSDDDQPTLIDCPDQGYIIDSINNYRKSLED